MQASWARVSWTWSRRLLRIGGDGARDRRERDGQPRGAVPGLVRDLVHRLVELQRAQEYGGFARISPAGRISVTERRAIALGPFDRAIGQLRVLIVLRRE